MTLTITDNRLFKYGQLELEDPGAEMSLEEVKDFYANVYPELTQSNIEGPDFTDQGLVYEFRKAVGTKGAGEDTISIGSIAKKGTDVQMHVKIAVSTNTMRSVARIILEAAPDGDDTLLAPSEMQGVVV